MSGWCRAKFGQLRYFYMMILRVPNSLQWRHDGRNGVSNHQPHYCLLNCIFSRRLTKTSKLRVTGLFEGNSPLTREFPAQRASNAENVSIWWRNHEWPPNENFIAGKTTESDFQVCPIHVHITLFVNPHFLWERHCFQTYARLFYCSSSPCWRDDLLIVAVCKLTWNTLNVRYFDCYSVNCLYVEKKMYTDYKHVNLQLIFQAQQVIIMIVYIRELQIKSQT